jgi:hypothetical protein
MSLSPHDFATAAKAGVWFNARASNDSASQWVRNLSTSVSLVRSGEGSELLSDPEPFLDDDDDDLAEDLREDDIVHCVLGW